MSGICLRSVTKRGETREQCIHSDSASPTTLPASHPLPLVVTSITRSICVLLHARGMLVIMSNCDIALRKCFLDIN